MALGGSDEDGTCWAGLAGFCGGVVELGLGAFLAGVVGEVGGLERAFAFLANRVIQSIEPT